MSNNPKLVDQSCPVRPCVIEKGLDNCARCDQYVCGKLKERLIVFEQVTQRVGANIPEDDYVCFIKPYENKRRLDVLRENNRR
jgi:hypothetical protein